MKLEFQIFPKEIIEEQFKTILQICTPELDHKEIMKRIDKTLVNRILTVTTHSTEDEPITLWRITKPSFDDFEEEKKHNYINPPAKNKNGKKCSKQRANIEGYPVMYTSIDPLTTVTEMKGSLGLKNNFFISRWKLEFKRPVVLHELVLNSQTTTEGSILNEYTKNQKIFLDKLVENIPDNLKEGHNHAIQKLGDLFTVPTEEIYYITSAYAHDVLYSSREQGAYIDGITYPSVENKHSSLNIAWHPDIINSECLILEEVFECRIEENNLQDEKQNVSITIFKRGIFNNDGGFSHWEKPVFSITDISWSEMQLKTYDGFVLKGREAEEIELSNNGINVKKLLEEFLFCEEIQSILSDYSDSKPREEMLSTKPLNFEEHIILPLDHGYQIATPNGVQCIELLTVPVKWKKYYKPVD